LEWQGTSRRRNTDSLRSITILG